MKQLFTIIIAFLFLTSYSHSFEIIEVPEFKQYPGLEIQNTVKPIQCVIDLITLDDILRSQKEVIVITGQSLVYGHNGTLHEITLAIYATEDLSTYTVLEIFEDGSACIISFGTDITVLLSVTGDNINYKMD
jgi:hypothetical protein